MIVEKIGGNESHIHNRK